MREGRRTGAGWTFAAATWAFVFALPSFYWAIGSAGLETIAADPEAALGAGAEPPALLVIGVTKVILGVVLLWLPRSRLRWNRVIQIAAWVVAVGLVLYGVANLVDHVLMLTGVRAIPAALGETAVRWHALFWDPYWILGGILGGMSVRSWDRRRGDALDGREGISG